tara:strand:- start:342 stop:1337 length:996 start_codon:yes stop_codon:yes gene_type:complete
MIIKYFEVAKKEYKNNIFLFYGENQGLKNEIIKKKFEHNFSNAIHRYEEKEILNNKVDFFNTIFSKSFFENKKLIIISRITDKIKDTIEEIIEKGIEDITIILMSDNLDKKSKIRSLFEKNKVLICVAFYADNNQTLGSIVNLFFKEKKIPVSQQTINLLVERSRGDRQNLMNELNKVENFIKTKKVINTEDLLKLTNLAENYNVSELIDCCLAKNRRRTINILNENNYSLEDCILIIRTFLLKSKRLLKLCFELEEKKNVESTISSFKPPIFWKDKEIVKQQITKWSLENAKELIYQINETELLIKKNSNNSINILSDFIIEQSTVKSNN